MIYMTGFKIDTTKGTAVSTCLKIDTADGDELSKRLFDILIEVLREALSGPRLEFDMQQNPPRGRYVEH